MQFGLFSFFRLLSYTHDIEAVSCDEMFVDVTGILEDTGVTPLDLARVLREEIKEKTQCNASAGLGRWWGGGGV